MVSLGAIVYFIIIPTLNNIKEANTDIIKRKTDLERRYNESKELKRTAQKINRIDPQIELLNKAFINKNRELEFITTLESIANNNSVVQTINLGSFQGEISTYTKIPLELILTGKLNNIMNYLIDLETLYYYININLLDLSNNSRVISQDLNGQNVITMTIKADTYWQ